MGTRIEVMSKESISTSTTSSTDLGLLFNLPIKVYNINDNSLTFTEIESIKRLLADPITDEVTADKPVLSNIPQGNVIIEVSPKPAVTDPEGKEAKKAIEKIIGRKIGEVSFSKQYLWQGDLKTEDTPVLQKQLGNPLINDFRIINSKNWNPQIGVGFHFPEVNLPEVKAFEYINFAVSDEELMKISDERLLALNLKELQVIKNLFSSPEHPSSENSKHQEFLTKRKLAGLEAKPTDAELECLAQTWSEHCKHKKFTGIWQYTSEDPNDESQLPEVTESVFSSIIKKPAEFLINEAKVDWLVSLFEDNSGVIKLNDKWNIAHKVETHNFPSTLDPFGGANTGTGGVFRDPKCTGKGMTIVSSQYGFRVPHPQSYQDLPQNILPPAKILQGVVSGVEDYGNKMGIPTMCGQVLIDDGWLKCAIYVGAVSVAPAEIKGKLTHTKEIEPGYLALSLGGKVGKDGIHGATASSVEQKADAEKDVQVNQAVQIGDPITEKGVFEAMNILLYEGLIEASQDCGAGGWNSAVGELAEISNGVVMDLSKAPEKYGGLKGWEKLVSEAQERVILVVKPDNLARVLEVCNHNNVEATKLAEFNDSGYYQVLDQKQTIVYLPMEFLHQGLPKMTIKAHWKPCENYEPQIALPEDKNLTAQFLELLGRPNQQLYDWIMTRYDHEVMGGSLIKPLVGKGRGKSDAIAYRPILTEKEAAIETWGSNPWQGDIDAYHMGRNNVVDAIGRIITVGGNLNKITFNGNTTCPKPEKDSAIAARVIRMLKGAADAQIIFGAPTISGKDSTSLERAYISSKTGEEINVKAKAELLMSALAIVDDDSTLITPDFKLAGDIIYIVGETKDELGASEYYSMNNETGKNVPKSNLQELKQRYQILSEAIKLGLVHSAQYIAKGGLAMALANSAIAGDLGVDINLDQIDECSSHNGLSVDKLLFSETTGRFIVTIPPTKKEEFLVRMGGQYVKEIGKVRRDDYFCINHNGKNVVLTNVKTVRDKNKGEIRF